MSSSSEYDVDESDSSVVSEDFSGGKEVLRLSQDRYRPLGVFDSMLHAKKAMTKLGTVEDCIFKYDTHYTAKHCEAKIFKFGSHALCPQIGRAHV